MTKRFLLICVILLSFIGNLMAQETPQSDTVKTYKITKNDGAVYTGQILSDDGREILIITEQIGKLYIQKSEIASIKEVKAEDFIDVGNLREKGPFKTRYYFTNNALPITKGEDYAMVHLYGPEVHFSVSNRLSIGVMATWITSPIGLALKYSIPTKNEKINFSLGTIMLSSGYLNKARGWGGLHWASVTYGSGGKNISVSTGVGYINFGISGERPPFGELKVASVSSIGAIFPIGERASFIFDSMISLSERRNYADLYGYYDVEGNPTSDPKVYNSGTEFAAFFMPGMRFQKTSKRAFQVALAGVVQYSTIGFDFGTSGSDLRMFPVPMCSWLFKF